MTTPLSSSLQDLSVCSNHPQIVSWQPKIRGRILETSNSWMTEKCTKNANPVYYKHPTHGYDQHDDQPTYPKSSPRTRNIQLMDDWHIQKDKKIHSPVTRMSWTWLCWMNSSLNLLQMRNNYHWEITHAEFKLYTPYMQTVRTRIQFYCRWKSR
jgi:hypothetical protein